MSIIIHIQVLQMNISNQHNYYFILDKQNTLSNIKINIINMQIPSEMVYLIKRVLINWYQKIYIRIKLKKNRYLFIKNISQVDPSLSNIMSHIRSIIHPSLPWNQPHTINQAIIMPNGKIQNRYMPRNSLQKQDPASHKFKLQILSNYRWNQSFKFRQNINRVFYKTYDDDYDDLELVMQNYRELFRVTQDLNKIKNRPRMDYTRLYSTQTTTTNTQYPNNYQQQQDYISNSTSYKLKKFQYLMFSIFNSPQVKKQLNTNLNEKVINSHRIRLLFQDLKQKYYRSLDIYQADPYSQFIFRQIAKNISEKMSYNVYLPSIMKVVISNINWIDQDNNIASIGLKLELKVNVPGISQYPHIYQSVFKNKMRVTFKTENKSYVYNEKIDFKQKDKTKQEKNFFITNQKFIQKNSNSSQFHNDAKNFFQQRYKWKNYDQPKYKFKKSMDQFQGFILQAKIYNVKALINKKTLLSPFQVLDLHGVIQVEPIDTNMNDWIDIIFHQDDNSDLKNFLLYACPKVTLKFNLISLYKDLTDVSMNKSISLNHIRSFDNIQHSDYNLAQSLMFLQITNNRNSNYQLRKFRQCESCQRWKRIDKQPEHSQYKNPYQYHRKISRKQFVRQLCKKNNHFFTQSIKSVHQFHRQLLQQCKESNIKINPNFKQNIEIENQIRQICKKDVKIQENSQKDYFIQEDYMFQKYLNYTGTGTNRQKILKNHLQYFRTINNMIDEEIKYIQKYLKQNRQNNEKQEKLNREQGSDQLALQLYKFSRRKYKVQRYYKRCLEVMIYDYETNNPQRYTAQQIQTNETHLKNILNNKHYKKDQFYHNSKAIYHFPLYRNPTQALGAIFVPLVFLCLINLVIFFQQNGLNDRLASLTSLMICFIGMLVILQQYIKSEFISIFQVIIYMMMFTPILCLGFSFYIYLKGIDNKPQQIKKFVLQSPLFWLSALITIGGFTIPLILWLIFKCVEEQKYNKDYSNQKSLQPLRLLMPGTQEVQRILDKQLDNEQKIGSQPQDFEKQRLKPYQDISYKKKSLEVIVISLMFHHVCKLYDFEQTVKAIKTYRDKIRHFIKQIRKSQNKGGRDLLENLLKNPVKKTPKQKQKQQNKSLFIFKQDPSII